MSTLSGLLLKMFMPPRLLAFQLLNYILLVRELPWKVVMKG
jgi:hypothetical protein